MSLLDAFHQSSKEFEKAKVNLEQSVKDLERPISDIPNRLDSLHKQALAAEALLMERTAKAKSVLSEAEAKASSMIEIAEKRLKESTKAKEEAEALLSKEQKLVKDLEDKNKLVDSKLETITTKEAILSEKLRKLDEFKASV